MTSTSSIRASAWRWAVPVLLLGASFAISAYSGHGALALAAVLPLLMLITWLVLNSRIRAVELARRATRDLEEALEALKASTRVLEEQASELDTMRVRAEFLATHDALTGLLNRRAWWEAGLATDLRAVALVDIDHFKRVNDEFGHPAGDGVLVEVADRLAELVGQRGVLGRIGGEEFGILFDSDVRTAAGVLAEVVTGVPLAPIRVSGFALPISVSGGLSAVARQGDRENRIGDAYASADAALYEAKSAGRAAWKVAQGRLAA